MIVGRLSFGVLQNFASFAALREKYVRVVRSDTNVPLRGIKNISILHVKKRRR